MPWTEIAYELPSGGFESIVLDATVRQQHDATAEVTTHPVEEGADVADHVRRALDRLTIEGVVTNAPAVVPVSAVGNPNVGFDGATAQVEAVALEVPSPPTQLNVSGLVGAAIDSVFPQNRQAQVLAFSAAFDRVRAVDARLRDLMETGTPVLVVTSLRDYERMEVVSYATTRDAATGDALRFVLDLQEVRVVSTEVVAAPPELRPRHRRGARHGSDPTDAEAGSARDHAESFLHALGGDGFRRAGEALRAAVGS
jgi:Dit-like tail protein